MSKMVTFDFFKRLHFEQLNGLSVRQSGSRVAVVVSGARRHVSQLPIDS
jgi:hypothetical protein